MRRTLWLVCFFSLAANAQYFNSNAFQFTLGWVGADTTIPYPYPNAWPTTDQLQIGLGYQYALSGYSLWWFTQSAVSLAYARNYSLSDTQVLAGVNALTGLRYNFMTEAWRPFIMGGIGLFTLFNNPNGTTTSGVTSKQFSMILEIGPGVEYIFTDEMSFQFDAGGLMFYDFANQPRISYVAKLSYLFYF